MASLSSSSTRSQGTTLGKPSERSRSEPPSQGNRARARSQVENNVRGPSETKQENMAEVQATGRQSDQGGRLDAGSRRSSNLSSR